MNDIKPGIDSKVHGADSYRYIIIGFYIIVSVINGMANNPLTPVSGTTEKTYQVTTVQIALTTTVCQIAQIAMSLPAVKIASTFGVRFSMTLGVLLLTLGFLTRTLINNSLYYVVLGQAIGGAGSPLITVIQARVVTDWFNKNQRGLWLALGALGPVLGVMVGFVMPLFFIDISPETSISEQKANMRYYLMFEAGIIAVFFVLIVIFWRASPGTIEEDSHEIQVSARETFSINDPAEGGIDSLFAQIKICFSRGAIRSMFVINGVEFGLVTAVGSLITPVLGAFSYPEYYGPLLAVSVILSGLIATIIYSTYMLKHRYQYKNKYILTGLSTIFFTCLCIAVYHKSSFIVIMLLACLFGMPGISITILVIEEIIRRVHGNMLMTATIINAISGQLVAALMTYTSGLFLESGNEYTASLVMTSFSVIFLLVFLYCFVAETRLKDDDNRKKGLKLSLIDNLSANSNSTDLNTSGASPGSKYLM